ncbi:right-handed parallel beta-helix repeat-containing protein [Sphingomonas sp. 37zxx]|uniref:right-handed parallel beta-helix repeat-containing protein n=1 Tax=Sphingomonas sp. 37zxx TaxID=1550073 RepID=UPI0018CD485F|nr:right-handed parallel beta-helix repeat-containing protein [Sphingomonas sp. 37zxx]
MLDIPPGEHHFYPDAALVRHMAVSNNDPGTNRIIFPVDDFDGLTIDGNGARLVFHGAVTPFALIGSRDITLQNMEIDWHTPFYCEGDVLATATDGTWLELQILENFSYRIDQAGQWFFVGEGFEQEGIGNILEFDTDRRETAFQALDNHFRARDGKYLRRYTVRNLGGRRVRVTAEQRFRGLPQVGNRVVIMPSTRRCPAIFVNDCARVRIENVQIRHAGCMGVIAQVSEDITIVRCEVAPRKGSARLLSTVVDATHFVNCTGTIDVRECTFANHLDDALNVHGIYVRILKATGKRALSCELSEFQQRGVRMIHVGDEVSIADGQELDVKFTGEVAAVAYTDDRYLTVTVDADLPDRVNEGDVINNLTRNAGINFVGNSVSANRARGILLSSLGNILVENCRFHTPGAALRISGGVDYWYESGPTANVTIRNNLFDNCKYGVWGVAVIDIEAVDGKKSTSRSPYHGRVSITGNRFVTFDGLLVHAYRVNHLAFTGNTVVRSNTYPEFRKVKAPIQATAVKTLDSTGNSFAGLSFAALSAPIEGRIE